MNTSGIKPGEYNILVKPDPVEERTKGGVLLPSSTQDREKYSVMKGTLVAASPMAYRRTSNGDEWLDPPSVGARVMFAQYAGASITGNDGEDYRIMKDEDVVGTIDD